MVFYCLLLEIQLQTLLEKKKKILQFTHLSLNHFPGYFCCYCFCFLLVFTSASTIIFTIYFNHNCEPAMKETFLKHCHILSHIYSRTFSDSMSFLLSTKHYKLAVDVFKYSCVFITSNS